MTKYNLPRGRLSYSEVSQWLKNKDQYRNRYYKNEKGIMTPEMYQGLLIGKMVEDNDPSVAFIPRFKLCEHFIEVDIEGIHVGGHLDSFDPDTLSFREMKTSRLGDYWTPLRVSRHIQLDFYSMLIEKKYGKVNNICYLDWVETRHKIKSVEFDGHILNADSQEIEATGNVKTFERNIHKYDRQYMLKTIKKVAEEIDRDYTIWQKENDSVDVKHLDR